MDKTIQLIVLTNNLKLVSQIEEMPAAVPGEPDCKLVNPCIITEGKMLEPYLMDYTRDSTLMMGSDKILTLTEPTMQILDSYKGLI